MVLRSMEMLWDLYKRHNKLYLSLISDDGLAEQRAEIKPNEKATVTACTDKARPVIVNQDDKVVYVFRRIIAKNEGYQVLLESPERRYKNEVFQ